MGLDMFLYKVKHDEVAYWRKANAIHGWFERKFGDDKGLENCRDYYVSKEDLIELRDTCQKVLDKAVVTIRQVKNGEKLNKDTGKWEPIYEDGEVIDNIELAQELLPTQDGFFFGSTDYDKWYIEELKSTIKQIDKVLETTDFDHENICYSAWW
jgi:hypothetical protein